ncbi:MAG: N-(5'-phosphoribosyl)anthranilate isomerase [Anaerolineae bacterium]|nr:N-(5'-phosphoribosyl)anthranilate isomerase [Anaerolineae bacterium]
MTFVKICGLTNLADARVAAEAGADLLGFIFYEASPRYVKMETVREIVTQLKESGVRSQGSGERSRGSGVGSQESGERHSSLVTRHSPLFVGVFVNAALETVQRTLDFCGLDAAQLHGDEPPEFVAALAGRAYKALRPPSLAEAKRAISQYQLTEITPESRFSLQPSTVIPEFLLDAYHPTLYGGTGHVTDWDMAAAVARQYRILLAGSLTPENVAQAVRAVRPWGVDVSSGVEAEKGWKDWAKVRAFIENVKNNS